MAYDFDLLVIGSGPAGQKAAIQAAKLGKRAVVVDRGHMIGGVCVNTGTIPSKTLREAVLYLTGTSQRGIYGHSHRVKDPITSGDLVWRIDSVIQREVDVVRHQLSRNGVSIVTGTARFADPHAVLVTGDHGEQRRITASKIVIAVGTRPARPSTVEFDGRTVIDSDDVLTLDWVPSSLLVVGAGVIGIEYASMFAALGTKVTVVERRPKLLEFCDSQIVEALQYHLRDMGVVFRFGEEVTAVEKRPSGAIATLASGKRIPAEAVLYSAGRQGATDGLELEQAGIEADRRGRIAVSRSYRTRYPAHLRRGRRDRVPQPGGDFDGAGTAGRVSCVRRRYTHPRRAAADRHLHDPRDQFCGPHRGGVDGRRRSLRNRHLPPSRARPRTDHRATRRGC